MNISQLKKKKKILLFSTICMTLEGIIQSEVKKRKTLAKWYHLSVESSLNQKKVELIETE